MKHIAHLVWRYVSYLYLRFTNEGFNYRAASLAYVTLLAIVPTTIISVSVLSLFPIFQGVGQELQHIIINNFVATSATIITQHLNTLLQHMSELSLLNLFFLVLICLVMIFNINRAFISIWQSQRHFRLTFSFIIYTLCLLFSPLLLGGALVLGSFFLRLPYINHTLTFTHLYRPLIFLLPHLLIFATFTVLNWVLPSCKVRLRHAALGGLITTVLFELAKYIFSLYLTHFSTYRLVYGALATIPIFLLWLYVAWTIILASGLITHLVARGMPQH